MTATTEHLHRVTPPTQPAQPPAAPPQFAMMQLLTAHWAARSIQVAAALHVADRLADGPVELARLAAEVDADPAILFRLLRALSTIGIFTQAGTTSFANTELSATLSNSHPHSVGDIARLFGRPWHHHAWTELETAVRTGRCALDIAHPNGLVAMVESNPKEGGAFDAGAQALGRLTNPALLAALTPVIQRADQASVTSLGGGHSGLPALLLERGLASHVHLIDRPRVTAQWRMRHRSLIDDGTLRVSDADLPHTIPTRDTGPAGDIVLLDRVLHDWDDTVSVDLLDAARRLLPATGRVVVIEQLLTPGDPRVAFLDLQMLVHRGGAERTVDQFTALAARADLTVDTVEPTYSPMTLLVLRPLTAAISTKETAP